MTAASITERWKNSNSMKEVANSEVSKVVSLNLSMREVVVLKRRKSQVSNSTTPLIKTKGNK